MRSPRSSLAPSRAWVFGMATVTPHRPGPRVLRSLWSCSRCARSLASPACARGARLVGGHRRRLPRPADQPCRRPLAELQQHVHRSADQACVVLRPNRPQSSIDTHQLATLVRRLRSLVLMCTLEGHGNKEGGPPPLHSKKRMSKKERIRKTILKDHLSKDRKNRLYCAFNLKSHCATYHCLYKKRKMWFLCGNLIFYDSLFLSIDSE